MATQLLTFYTRTGCHLCDDARDLVRELAAERGLTVAEVDILEGDGAYRLYHERIPVVALDGVVIAEGRITEGDLRANLEARGEAHA